MMPSASPKQRVLIVGAKFGEMYLNAFMQPPEGLELVGLLAQGSARSRELAHAFGIPLYTSPEQITRMPDIACIVVRSTVAGGTGTQLARHFLTRGVHVIQEHPLHPDDISSLQTLAQEQGCCYWVNTFYPHTRAGRTWLRDAQQLRRCLAKTPPSTPPPADSCSTPLWICCCWLWALMPPPWSATWLAALAIFTV